MKIKSEYSFEDTTGGSGTVMGFDDGEPLLELERRDCVIKNPEEFCRAIYAAANLEWPAAPDLGPLREALLDLRARWDANGTTVEEITYLLKVAEDMEIIPPAKPDPLEEMRVTLWAMANNDSLTIVERRKAAIAMDALS